MEDNGRVIGHICRIHQEDKFSIGMSKSIISTWLNFFFAIKKNVSAKSEYLFKKYIHVA